MIDMDMIRFKARCTLAERDFFEYCHLFDNDFYSYDKPYIVDLCNRLQAFKESDSKVMVVNLPPRFGKSRTSQLFVQWCLGKNPHERIMTGSYNEQLSTLFAKTVRNAIMEIKSDPLRPVYSDVFPNTSVKRGDGAMNIWSLEGSSVVSYLATSPSGTATGIGCTMMILDDLIKNAEEAYNETKLEKDWDWFVNTMFSRKEGDWKVFIIGTRWATGDVSGRAIEHFQRIGVPMEILTYKAVQDDGTMLCEDVLSRDDFEIIMKTADAQIVSANYNQQPIDLQNCLYPSHKTYVDVPTFNYIKAYVDVADEGEDYLACVVYGVTKSKEAYVLDILYSQAHNEVTEPAVAKMLVKHNVGIADIESNGGGRGFARQVERIMLNELHSNRCRIQPFYQTKNKEARILSNATWVCDHIYFPENWSDRWNDAYLSFIKYQRQGKAKHDDFEDALTGVAEKCNSASAISF